MMAFNVYMGNYYEHDSEIPKLTFIRRLRAFLRGLRPWFKFR